MFKIGDVIFYPMHGAGVIESVEEKEILGEIKPYYILKIPHINVQIMIPEEKAASSGMRKIVDRDTMESILEHFNQGETDPDIYENSRYCLSVNKDKMKSGNIHQGTEIIRDLTRKSKRIKLGIEDKNMLDHARQILVSELAQVKGINTEEAQILLDRAINDEEIVLEG